MPSCKHGYDFKYNCFKQNPAPWNLEVAASGVAYDEKTMFANYDEEGFDNYGYSAFDADGNYDFGSGVDLVGRSNIKKNSMDENDFAHL